MNGASRSRGQQYNTEPNMRSIHGFYQGWVGGGALVKVKKTACKGVMFLP